MKNDSACWWLKAETVVNFFLSPKCLVSVSNINVTIFLEWVDDTSAEDLRKNSTMDYNQITDDEMNTLEAEYDFSPAALLLSDEFNPKECLARLKKVSIRTVLPAYFRLK